LARSIRHNSTTVLTSSPATLSPTRKPTRTEIAVYDDKFGASYCENAGNACDSGITINGMDGYELISPNHIDWCPDYSIGTYRVDNSIEKIIDRPI
jgi:hypothetical protein